jgi:predicted RNA-binding protein with PUA-like domain
MKHNSQYWLLKTEGEVYPIDALKKDKKTPWSGVRNYQARNFMKDTMRVGDLCLFFHSSSKANGVYGVARVASKSYPDPAQFDKKSDYFEPKATQEKPYWWLVDVAFVKKFKEPVLVGVMKNDPKLGGMLLWRAHRLSIQPVSPQHFKYMVDELAK